MLLRWVAATVTLAACGGARSGGATSAASSDPAPQRADRRPACITPPDDGSKITHATVDGTKVAYCVGSDRECFALDTATGKLERLGGPPKPAGASNARVETTNPDLKVCSFGSCTSLTPKVLPNASTIVGAANPDGTFAVFLLGDAKAGRGYAEVWDVATTKKTATFRYARGEFRCGEVAVLEDTIFVSASMCDQPAARGGLYTLRGRKVANVGGKDFGTWGGAFARVDGPVWAFLEENGNQLVIQDVVTGKVKKTIDTSLLFKDGGAAMGNPGESAIVRLADGRLAIVAGAPASGSVATVEVETGAVTVMPVPRCGQ
ncbi:MAG TPA: hypothetical protein VFQ53_25505 [Kofleriaceae bacterium]|nr:hypothetical protein [Kofleriaceae bacterium]